MATRFAPSMTGYLHLGHLYHLIYLYATARHRGLPVYLRIEDHDLPRARKEYERALFEDLKAFGITWERSVVRQRDRLDYYQAQLDYLSAAGRVYGCACSRREIRASQSPGNEAVYDGRCADKGLPLEGHTVRFRVEPEQVVFRDERLGAQVQEPAKQCGDFSLRDRAGHYSYHFAAVCDDLKEDISLVIRGEDLLSATGRQQQLYSAFGAPPPAYLHHPLIYDKQGKKLSKRAWSQSLRSELESGLRAEELVARVLGLDQPCSFQEAIEEIGLD